MIKFTKITAQNFLSVGNNEVEIPIDTGFHLVTGSNGSGKSSILLDSLSFALYGKGFRKIVKGALVNSTNKKKCLVTLEFTIGNDSYRIVRGIKPDVFEIYINDNMLPQMANVRDYQEYLEKKIVKIDNKTFRQIITLGSSSYKPFMELSAAERRTVIDDLLGLDVFGNIQKVIKTRLSEIDKEITLSDNTLYGLNNKLNELERMGSRAVDAVESQIKEQLESSVSLLEKITEKKTTLENLIVEDKSEYVTEHEGILDLRAKASNIKSTLQNDINRVTRDNNFYQSNEICPTCHQEISMDLRNKKIGDGTDMLTNFKKKIATADLLVDSKKSRGEELQSLIREIDTKQRNRENLTSELRGMMNTYKSSQSTLESLRSRLRGMESDNSGDILSVKTEIEKESFNLEAMKIKKMHLTYLKEMYKDTGIKAKVVDSYVPIMNQCIVKYLEIMEFNMKFEFDSSFNETIKSRGRDKFSYNNFSMGEALRLDVAIMLTMRDIAELRSSAHTNLMIMDEFTGGVSDPQCEYAISNLLVGLRDKGTCIFFITHSPETYIDIVDSHMYVNKINNFTKLEWR